MAGTAQTLRLAMVLGCALFLSAAAVPAAAPPIDIDARARAEGNRLDAAVSLGRILLRGYAGPAQILRVRVDGIGRHSVAGVLLEAKPKRPLSKAAFFVQVAGIAQAALDRPAIEEVDIWAVVPIAVAAGAVVSGPMAVPTTKTVFAATFRRAERPSIASKMLQRRGIYVDPLWEAMLVAEGPLVVSANPPKRSVMQIADMDLRIVS